jgi:flagellar basal body rod protein FlgG
VVLIDGLPQGQIGVFDASGAALDQADPALPVAVRQGMIVPANINLGDEMIELGKASRQAETGARLFQIQDDVLSQVASKLGTIAR